MKFVAEANFRFPNRQRWQRLLLWICVCSMVDESPVTQCITILMNLGYPGYHMLRLILFHWSVLIFFLIDRYNQHIPSDSLHWVRAPPHYDVLYQLTPWFGDILIYFVVDFFISQSPDLNPGLALNKPARNLVLNHHFHSFAYIFPIV